MEEIKPFRILSIDPGIRGLAWTLIEKGKVIEGDVTDLCAKIDKDYNEVSNEEIIDLLIRWWKDNCDGFFTCGTRVVAIEKQLVLPHDTHKGRMIAVECMLAMKFKECGFKVHFQDPKAARRRIGVTGGTHRYKKQMVRERLEEVNSGLTENVVGYDHFSPKNRGDVADAALTGLVMYEKLTGEILTYLDIE